MHLALALVFALASLGPGELSSSVVVRNAYGGAPVKDAEVRWAALASVATERGSLEPDLYEVLVRDELFERGEPLARTDADGRAHFERPAEHGFVCVRAGELRGAERAYAEDSRELSLSIYPDFAVDVEVVDPSGAAVDELQVSLRYGRPDEHWSACATRVPLVHGRARLEHAGFLQGRIGYDRRFFVGIDGWYGPPPMVAIPTAKAPDTPVRLALPPSGSVAVRFVDELGRPTMPLGFACIGEPARAPENAAWRAFTELPPELRCAGYVRPDAADSRVRLRRVGLGARLQARAQRNELSTPSFVEFDGPARAGEEVEVEVRLGAGCVTLAGRVLWPEGAPLVEYTVEHLFADSSAEPPPSARSWFFRALPLAPDGRFVVDLAPDRLGAPDRPGASGRELALLWRRMPSPLPRAPEPQWESHPLPLYRSIALDERWTPGFHDLGDLVLEQLPEFASGRVVAARTGEPLANVSVRAVAATDAIQPVFVVTDATGRFAFHAVTRATALELEFRAPSTTEPHAARIERVERGSRDLRIELPAN
ncbi:MAG: carboxypeptidase regulatory-like domain-containing protein [Planctomycetes bacterium]|nr:carboxypeptidase regulatory-like domain-containing protein [Planctomycetota bacterium]